MTDTTGNSIKVLSDEPINNINEDFLNLRNYAAVLGSLVKTTDTPITIGIQGDWGSGKSSLMNLIKQEIDSESNQGSDKSIYTLKFNSWQFSQFNMEEQLTTSLLLHFLEKIRKINGGLKAGIDQRVDELRKIISKLPLEKVSLGFKANSFNVRIDLADKESEPSEKIKLLDKKLRQLVNDTLGNQKRLVIFIDDLDRLLPEQAVSLLESLKLFLDLTGCVFVISCDRQVVAEGVKQKFKHDDPKGKSFFDKIIQVPLDMPNYRYGDQVIEFCRIMLERIGIKHLPDEDISKYLNYIASYRALANYSIGFNPRTVKRFFNSLWLSKSLLEREEEGKRILTSEEVRILFAIRCLEETYRPLYDYILRANDDDSFKKMMEKAQNAQSESNTSSNGEFKSLREELIKLDSRPTFLAKFADFSQIFSLVIGNIKVKELKKLILQSQNESFPSSDGEPTDTKSKEVPLITPVEETRFLNRQLMNEIILKAEKEYEKYLKELAPLIGEIGFKRYQPDQGLGNDCYILIYLDITPPNKSLRFRIHHEAKFDQAEKYIRHYFRWWLKQGGEGSKIHNWFMDNIHSLENFKELQGTVKELKRYNLYRVKLYDNQLLPVDTSREYFDKKFKQTTFDILEKLLPHLVQLHDSGEW